MAPSAPSFASASPLLEYEFFFLMRFLCFHDAQGGHAQSALNTPVVALQTPSVPAGYSSFGPADYSSDLGSLAWSHQRYVDDLSMYSAATMSSIR